MRAHGKGAMDQFSAHLDRGWDLVARGDLAGAMVSARKTLELDADSPEAHNLIGYVHAAEGNAEDALEHYRQAIEADETFVEAMLNAAEVLLHPYRDYEGAIRAVDDALELCQTDDEIADALLLKVDILLHGGDKERAAKVVRQLPAGPFDNKHIEFLVGRARYEVGDTDGAEPSLRSAVDEEPDNPEPHYYLGLLLESRGDARGATLAFLRSRDRDLRTLPPTWSIEPAQFERKVQEAMRRLPLDLADKLEGALVVVSDVPGAEVVADGVDPRMTVLVDDAQGSEPHTRVGRVFVYQRNVERLASGLLELEDEIYAGLERELRTVFPELGGPATQVPEHRGPQSDVHPRSTPSCPDDEPAPDAGKGE